MTGLDSRRLIIGSFAAAGVLTVIRDVSKGEAPRLRVLFGVLIGAALLSMLSELNPGFAGGLALLFLLSSVLTSGGALDAITGAVSTH